MTTLRAIQGDITKLSVDAIVNAANTSVAGRRWTWMGPSTGPRRSRTCWRNAGLSGAARQEKPRSQADIDFPPSSSSTRLGPSGANGGESGEESTPRRLLPEFASSWRRKGIFSRSPFRPSAPGVYSYPLACCDGSCHSNRTGIHRQPETSLNEIIFCCYSLGDLKIYDAVLADGGKTSMSRSFVVLGIRSYADNGPARSPTPLTKGETGPGRGARFSRWRKVPAHRDERLADKDVVLVGGTIGDTATLELYDLACAVVKYGARSLDLLIPYFSYSTMERAAHLGEVVTAKTPRPPPLFHPRCSGAGQSRLLLLDLAFGGNSPLLPEGNDHLPSMSTESRWC